MRNDEVLTRFGAAVKVMRKYLGISQEELGGRAGLHRTYICDVERGTRNLSLESIYKLAGALEISVSRLFTQATEGPHLPGGGEIHSHASQDILLVEDDPRDVEMTLEAFKKARFTNRVQIARDGAEALEFLFHTGAHAHSPRRHKPLVILLDLNLPKISGLEVLQRIKAAESTRSIPVIVLTASNTNRDFLESRRLGMEAYIVKPVDFVQFNEVALRFQFNWALVKPALTADGSQLLPPGVPSV